MSLVTVTGKNWQELIDLDSWARKYLLEEIFANVDACSISQFFYADGSGKIYAGPAWDYDGAMGNFVPESLFGNRVQACEGKPLPWFSTLYRKDFFIEKVKQLYAAEFRPLLSQLLSEKLGDYADRIQMASRMNSIRWAGTDMLPEVEAIKTYMEARMAFLDNLWISERPYCIVYADLGPDMNGVNYAVVPGGMLPPLPEYTDSDTTDYHGWYIKNTEEPFDNAMPIFEDMEIFLKQTSLTAQTSDDAVLPETDYEASEEPVSVVRLLPGMVFGGMLVLLFLLDRQKRKTGGQ